MVGKNSYHNQWSLINRFSVILINCCVTLEFWGLFSGTSTCLFYGKIFSYFYKQF